MQPSYLFLYHLPWRKASIVLEIRPRIASSASGSSPSSGTYSGSGVRSCGTGAVVVSASGQAAGAAAGFSEENDCIGDILCFPVVRLLFQQFDSCQMDRVTDIEPQGKPPSFFLNSHSRHLPTASRRYRYS